MLTVRLSKTESIQYEEITASDYFASTNGPKTVTACSTQIKPRDSQKLKAENASLCRNDPTTFHSNLIDDDADLEILDKSNVANAALNSDLNSQDKLKDGENTKIADNDEKKNLSKLLDSKIQDSKSSLSGRKDVVRDISPLSELDKNHQFSDVDNSKEISVSETSIIEEVKSSFENEAKIH